MAMDKKSKASKKSTKSEESALPSIDGASQAVSKPSRKSKESKKTKEGKKERKSKKDSDAKSTASGETGSVGSQEEAEEGEEVYMAEGGVNVPYDHAPSLEQQTKTVVSKILDGMKDVVGKMVSGQNSCADRAEIDGFCNKLQSQAQKIVEAVQKDAVYVEEVRHHHNRISDLCDNTRAYDHGMMVADLKRATNIRREVLTVIKGSAPDWELDPDEQDELRAVRNMLRRMFGGKKNQGGLGDGKKSQDEMTKEAMCMAENTLDPMAGCVPSSVHPNVEGSFMLAAGEDAKEFETNLRTSTDAQTNILGGGGSWAMDLVNGNK